MDVHPAQIAVCVVEALYVGFGNRECDVPLVLEIVPVSGKNVANWFDSVCCR